MSMLDGSTSTSLHLDRPRLDGFGFLVWRSLACEELANPRSGLLV